MATGRRSLVVRHHFAVSVVPGIHIVVAVVGDIAAAAVVVGVAGPFPVEIVCAKEMQRASGGFHCLQTEAWQ